MKCQHHWPMVGCKTHGIELRQLELESESQKSAEVGIGVGIEPRQPELESERKGMLRCNGISLNDFTKTFSTYLVAN